MPLNLNTARSGDEAQYLLALPCHVRCHRPRHAVINNERNIAHACHSKQNGTYVAARHVDRHRRSGCGNRQVQKSHKQGCHHPTHHTVYSLVSVIVPDAESSVADRSESARSVYPCHTSPMPSTAPSSPRARIAMRTPSAPVTTPRRTRGAGGGAGGTAAVGGVGGTGEGSGSSVCPFCSTAVVAEGTSCARSCASENGLRRGPRFAAAESPVISVADGAFVSMCCTMVTGCGESACKRYTPLNAHRSSAPTSARCRADNAAQYLRHVSITRTSQTRRKGLPQQSLPSWRHASPPNSKLSPSVPGVSVP